MISSQAHLTAKLQSRGQSAQTWAVDRPNCRKAGSMEKMQKNLSGLLKVIRWNLSVKLIFARKCNDTFAWQPELRSVTVGNFHLSLGLNILINRARLRFKQNCKKVWKEAFFFFFFFFFTTDVDNSRWNIVGVVYVVVGVDGGCKVSQAWLAKKTDSVLNEKKPDG